MSLPTLHQLCQNRSWPQLFLLNVSQPKFFPLFHILLLLINFHKNNYLYDRLFAKAANLYQQLRLDFFVHVSGRDCSWIPWNILLKIKKRESRVRTSDGDGTESHLHYCPTEVTPTSLLGEEGEWGLHFCSPKLLFSCSELENTISS